MGWPFFSRTRIKTGNCLSLTEFVRHLFTEKLIERADTLLKLKEPIFGNNKLRLQMNSSYRSFYSANVWLGVVLVILLLSQSFELASQSLEDEARAKITSLQTKIQAASQLGIDTQKEQMTVRTAEVFLEFADWDEANMAANTDYFSLVNAYKDTAAQSAAMLPGFERSEVVRMLDQALQTITALIEGKIYREPTPAVDWSAVSHSGDQLLYNNRPVFLADYTWKPGITKLTDYFGDLDGFYIDQNKVTDATGKINTYLLNQLKAKGEGTAGFIFIGNKVVPSWAETLYGPGFKMRENTYTGYDIDNPGALELNGMLIRGTVPYMAGKKYSELGYMLCNEPHFYTTTTGTKLDWASGPVSNYTIEKFKIWLKEKHGTITNLNTLWGTNFASFDAVTIQIPIDNSLQGTAKWYDWTTFNCCRVTQWYTALKDTIRKYDPQAKAQLKNIPNMWTDNKRGHGIDMEALTELSEIIGNDAGSENAPMWGGPYWWQAKYALDWRELFMGNDFYKSVGPDKIMLNSEAHFLSTVRSRDLFQDPKYARATFWAATVTGMNATQIWFWPREADGSMSRTGEKGYAGSNCQQPRIVNEVASTFMDMNTFSEEITAMQRQRKPIRIFYSEASATNKPDHMDDVFALYESLSFEGIPLGFATKNILSKQNPTQWDMVLIYQTEYVTQAELAAVQSYLNGGGTVLIDGVSLKKDEYKRALPALTQGNGQLIVFSDLAAMKAKALQLAEAKGNMPPVAITETNTIGAKTCVWKCVKNAAGHPVLSVINLGKTDSKLNIQLKNANVGTTCKDLINGVVVSSTPTLKPYDVFFVEITDDNQIPTGVSDLEQRKAIRSVLYPNPTTGAFSIDFEDTLDEVAVSVYDINGKPIHTKKYYNVDQIKEELSNYPVGLYLVRLKSDEDSQSFILIKQG